MPCTRRRVIAIIVPTVLAAGLVAAPEASACSCAGASSPCRLLQSAPAIFVGTPVAVNQQRMDRMGPVVRFTFEVEETVKGPKTKTVDVETLEHSAACGYPFRLGVKYLVYASVQPGGALTTGFCSRTGPLDDRRDDLELLKETAAGPVRPRLFGVVVRRHLAVDGGFMQTGGLDGMPNIPIRLKGYGDVAHAVTDADGHFTIVGVTPGRYVVEPVLPPFFAPSFHVENVAAVDDCSGEVFIFVSNVAIEGTVRPADGEQIERVAKLRVFRLGDGGGVAVERSTLAFVKPDGKWEMQGLPPGRYVVGISAFDAPSPDSPYPTRWYPDARRPEDATVVEVCDDRTVTVDFRLPPRLTQIVLRGRTVDAKGDPVPNVSVTLFDADDYREYSTSHADSDADGRFLIKALRGRRYRIKGVMFAPGGGAESSLIDVPANAVDEGITVRLDAKR